MCQTTNSDIDDMDEISSTSSSQLHKRTGKHIEPRKIRKPLMEKKRRARINQSLDELKRIVIDAEKLAGQDLSRVNKLEKADILEMTVRYLKRSTSSAQPQQRSTSPQPTSKPDVYLAGYKQCVEQVQELLAEQWTDERRQQSGRRMVEHLEACVQRLDALPRPSPPPKNRLSSTSSSDESMNLATASTNLTSCSSSEDDYVVEDEQQIPGITAAAAMVRGTRDESRSHHTTQFQDTPPKPMWRPW